MTAVNTVENKVLGRTGLVVSSLCVGTSAWGLVSPVHNVVVPEEDAVGIVHAAFESALNFLDTSNNYGDGESERRIGLALASRPLPPDFIIQTKLDRDPITNSFDSERLERSLEESLGRLGLGSVPILYLHDPEWITFEEAIAAGGPVEMLVRFRDAGYAKFIGISGGPAKLLQRFVETGIFDALVTHNRFTLVDHTSDELISVAHESGLGVVNAAVYGGGILARWPRTSDRYHYAPARPRVLAAVDAMGSACERYGVPLIAAALQASTRDPRIDSTVCGVVSPAQLAEAMSMLDVAIPEELWTELDRLIPERSEWIND